MLRVLLLPGVAYGLARDDGTGMAICVTLFVVAGISDFLDGYLARRLNQVSPLGIALDPIADKIFAGATVVLLVVYRDLPVWLALVVVGRDLLILGAGAILLRGRKITLPSNLVGKYTFGILAFLLGSYVIRFHFGITLTTIATLIMIAWSLVSYAQVFLAVRSEKEIPEEAPPWQLWLLRIATGICFVAFVIKLYIYWTS
jgi:CDP-diacylglycerol--glycerol-3-phosphate 3-phosphatidyltransferase